MMVARRGRGSEFLKRRNRGCVRKRIKLMLVGSDKRVGGSYCTLKKAKQGIFRSVGQIKGGSC